ncbi:unnamed protein product [Brugia timori]|uniref:Anoctamin n=1 Tax=Brugia timori TaxID=42155 RepID=A0A0R3QXH5_9BILA|nr:unnamed protein product [Brugia timori]
MQILETVGKVKWDEYPLRKGDSNSICSEEESPPESLPKRIVKLIKILIPHVGLITLLLTYIAIGALIFIWLEADNELQNRRSKLQKVLKLYSMIINETFNICMPDLIGNNTTRSSVCDPQIDLMGYSATCLNLDLPIYTYVVYGI